MNTTSKSTDDRCIRLEEIAALIDGRLAHKEQEEMVTHLGECSACYEIFAETLRFHVEEEPVPAPQVVPHPTLLTPRPAWLAGLAVAAAALFAAVFLVPHFIGLGGGLDPTLPTDELVARITQGDSVAMVVASTYSGVDWFRTRGGQVGMSAGQLSFRLGVRMVDLQAALAAGEAGQAEHLLVELMETARPLPSSEAIFSSYDDLLQRLRGGERAVALARDSAEVDDLLTQTAHDPLYTFGKWAEAGLLTTRIGNVGVLNSRNFRTFPSRLEQQELAEDIERALDRAESLLKTQPIGAAMTDLEDTFLHLVSRGGNL